AGGGVALHATDRRHAPEVARASQVAEIGVVDAAVLAFQPDPVGADRPELIDQVGVVGSGHDGRHLTRGEPLFDAIRSNAHVDPSHVWGLARLNGPSREAGKLKTFAGS